MKIRSIRFLKLGIFMIPAAAILWAACATTTEDKPAEPVKPIGAGVEIKAPLGLPAVPTPEDNPPTAETIALGRNLYYDPLLSVDDTIACASCHHPDFGFTDGKRFSAGVGGQLGGRSAPTVINSAYNDVQFWDGRSPSLEDQAEGPVQNSIEMAHTLDGVVKKLTAHATYPAEFEKAYGPGAITYEKVEKAIATFERTVLSGNSPYDRFQFGGEKDAISESAKRGFEVFRDPKKGNCAVCHSVGEKTSLFTDNKFHNIGVGVVQDETGAASLSDVGRFEVTQVDADRGAFKTPTLRNISQSAPYMHDGSLGTLKEVVDFYVGGGNSNDQLDKEIKVLDYLTGRERADLEEFLKSLTAELPADVGPPEDM